jgi:hypothetical protein
MMMESIARTDGTSGLATLYADARAFAGPDDDDSAAEPDAGLAVDARVLTLAPPRHGRALCICSNLTTTADAFAQLSGEELFALPAGLRRHVHDALVGVWQILDLVQRMEEAGLGEEGEGPHDSVACAIGSDQPHGFQTQGAPKTRWSLATLRALRDRVFPGA